jgi:hypothetical protein
MKKKPYFYLNYEKKRSVIINRKRETITTASDVAQVRHESG